MRLGAVVLVVGAAVARLASPAGACTVSVVSGSATPDGRPLLWKNRDSDARDNRLMLLKGERFVFVGLVDGDDAEGKEVWAGVNEAGFCIMNSASYNLYREEEETGSTPARRKDEEGLVMKAALGRCASVEDFARLLEETSGNRGVEANFGVIDASGGAAFFETDNEGFVRFDASDRRVAPEGYILRTNFSLTGEPNQGAGEIRYDRSSLLFHRAVAGGGIRRDWLLQVASRDMVNGLTGDDPFARELPVHAGDARYYYASDTTVRDSATATILFQGVAPDEDPARTVMWARLGHPLCSVALPHWVAAGDAMPLTAGANPPMVRFADLAYRLVFPFAGTSRERYLDLAPLVNRQGGGILPRLIAVEEAVQRATDQGLPAKTAPLATTLARVQRDAAETARERLRALFPEAAAAAGL